MFKVDFRLRILNVFLLNCVLSTGQAGNFVTGIENQNESTHKAPDMAVSSEHCGQPDKSTLAAIVRVATDHGNNASGVVYARNRVLTAAHAIKGGAGFFVQIDDSYRRADLILVDHKADLAVLAISTGTIEPVTILEVDGVRSETVWAVGYPGGQEMSADRGRLQRVDAGVVYASASVDSGQSGGGLLACHDGAWSMVGMLRGFGATWQQGRYVRMHDYSVSVAAQTINYFFQAR